MGNKQDREDWERQRAARSYPYTYAQPQDAQPSAMVVEDHVHDRGSHHAQAGATNPWVDPGVDTGPPPPPKPIPLPVFGTQDKAGLMPKKDPALQPPVSPEELRPRLKAEILRRMPCHLITDVVTSYVSDDQGHVDLSSHPELLRARVAPEVLARPPQQLYQCKRCKRWFLTEFNSRRHFFCLNEAQKSSLSQRAAEQDRLREQQQKWTY